MEREIRSTYPDSAESGAPGAALDRVPLSPWAPPCVELPCPRVFRRESDREREREKEGARENERESER